MECRSADTYGMALRCQTCANNKNAKKDHYQPIGDAFPRQEGIKVECKGDLKELVQIIANTPKEEAGKKKLVAAPPYDERHYFRVTMDYDSKARNYDDMMVDITSNLNLITSANLVSVNEDDDCPN